MTVIVKPKTMRVVANPKEVRTLAGCLTKKKSKMSGSAEILESWRMSTADRVTATSSSIELAFPCSKDSFIFLTEQSSIDIIARELRVIYESLLAGVVVMYLQISSAIIAFGDARTWSAIPLIDERGKTSIRQCFRIVNSF